MQRLPIASAKAGFLWLTLAQFLGAQHEPAWVEQAPYSSRPDGRWGHAMAYFPATGTTVLFGGRDASGLIPGTTTWYWHGFDPASPVPPRTGDWTSLTGAGPAAREGHSMVFEAARNIVLLFGGRTQAGYLDDTYLLAPGGQWGWAPVSPQPMPRSHAAMAYDTARNRVVLFGGFNGTAALADTWEWDSAVPGWSQRFPTTFPSPRYGAGMAFDSRRNRMVAYGGNAFGGITLNDTWEYDGTTWSPSFPSTSPGPRYTPAMAFDELRGVTVLFGGFLLGNETWEYDGVDWHQRAPRVPLPYPRGATAMAYDSHRQRMVMFGGNEQGLGLSDTWEYRFAYGYETWGPGCAGSEGVPVLYTSFTSPGLLGNDLGLTLAHTPSGAVSFVITGLSTSSWSGGPLPADLTALGMSGCRLYVRIDAVGLTVSVGSSASFTLQIPSNPMFLGYQLHNQAMVIDPLAGNPLGAVVSNAGTVVIGN